LLGAAAFFARQTGLLFLGVPLYAILRTRTPLSAKCAALLRVAAGAALVTLLVVGLVWCVGDLRAFWHTVFVYPRLYTGRGDLVTHFWSRELLQSRHAILLLGLLGLSLWSAERWLVCLSLSAGLLAVWLPRKDYPHYLSALIPTVALMLFVSFH